MKISFHIANKSYSCETQKGQVIAINMDFEGPQPNHFGTENARRSALELGGFVGSTERGGSCNVDVIQLIPHCNGTHTETVSHIVDDKIFVGQSVRPELVPAVLITVRATDADGAGETYRPKLDEDDQIISAATLKSAFKKIDAAILEDANAIVIRTLPNETTKKSRKYSEENEPAFLSVEAMQLIVEQKFQHLLLDLPSVDRMYDDGKLTCHHLFWNVAEESHQLSADSLRDKTITEMVYVPDNIKDGLYLLSLQVPALFTDAAPSRPVLYPVKLES